MHQNNTSDDVVGIEVEVEVDIEVQSMQWFEGLIAPSQKTGA